MENYFLNSFKSEIFLSVHIPKTAGSLLSYLYKISNIDILFFNYGLNNLNTHIFYNNEIKLPKEGQSHEELFFEICSRVRGIAVMHGHFHPRRYQLILNKVKLITWLRDPFQLLCSLYYYWKRWKPKHINPLYDYFISKEFDLLDFVTDSRFANVQSKYLEGVNLNDFVFCGFVEEMEKSLDNLSSILPLNTSNVSNKKINYNLDKVGELYTWPMSDELVRKANSDDYKLYQHGKSLFLK